MDGFGTTTSYDTRIRKSTGAPAEEQTVPLHVYCKLLDEYEQLYAQYVVVAKELELFKSEQQYAGTFAPIVDFEFAPMYTDFATTAAAEFNFLHSQCVV